MKDIYKEYTGETFEYDYPIKWENRSPDYLNLVNDRKPYQDYMFSPDKEEN